MFALRTATRATRIAARNTRPVTRRALTQSAFRHQQHGSSGSAVNWSAAVAVSALVGAAVLYEQDRVASASSDVNWDEVKADILAILANDDYDDGSYGPVLVRLAWHAAGTFDKTSNTGGSDGATMRFAPESGHGANAGLDVARALLEPIKARHPAISYSDLWQFAAVVAIEDMGGPKIAFRPGRTDKTAEGCTPDGRLPDAAQGANHLRDIFYRMGFTDREIVALSGAHALGRCHTSRSGFDGPWTKAPTMFSNEYYRELLENEWTIRKWGGPLQYKDASDTLMMLPTDIALIRDDKFRHWVEKYKDNEELFFQDFAHAFKKLQENNVKALRAPWWKFW